MGIFDAWKAWRQAQREKRVARAREKGICPDCHGHGYNIMMFNDAVYVEPDDLYCPSCNGSGSFAQWETTQRNLQ